MILFLKGFVVGLGKVLPGVSGSLLAIRLNIYEEVINRLNNLFGDLKNNIVYLTKIAFGILCSILISSKLLIYLLDKYYNFLLIVFVMLIISGIPKLKKEISSYFLVLISFLIYICILYIPNINIGTNYYILGFIEALTTIIPGISGTAIFMSLGVYDEVLALYSNIYLLELNKLIPFGLGFLLCSLLLIRFVNQAFLKHRGKTYSIILGLLLASVLIMIIKK